MQRRENLLYVGIDLHKETHTAVMVNCWNEKLEVVVIENKPSEFKKLAEKVNRKSNHLGLVPIYGLENAYGYGRSLAVWLIENEYIVKDINPALAYDQRKSAPMLRKNDEHDAYCVATVLINQLHTFGNTIREYQESRDFITTSLVRDLEHQKEELAGLDKEIEKILLSFDYKLTSMPGIGTSIASKLIAEIGDIRRFSNADKLARFAGVAPVKFSSAEKGKEQSSRQGNRQLHGLCIMRRLVNIVYGMMKNKTEYREPNREEEQ